MQRLPIGKLVLLCTFAAYPEAETQQPPVLILVPITA